MEAGKEVAKMDKNAFLWFGILAMVFSFILLSGFTFAILNMGFVVFLGIILMPISMASFAAGLLKGSRMRIAGIFLIYLLFFGIIFLVPSFM